ncbi:MAG: ABC transporter substrate-binding protein [Promethearchaeota archaeon]
MKKHSKRLIFILFLSSLFLPILPTAVKAQDETPIFIVGVCGPRPVANWDPVCFVVSDGQYYMDNALETVFAFKVNSSGSRDDLIPVLATSWTFEDRPVEQTDAGFYAYDGIKSMEITLRENVTFHDGSAWNATVFKWNIDRIMTLLGNITGALPTNIYLLDSNVRNMRSTYWLEYADWVNYATPSWNVTDIPGGTYAEWGTCPYYTERFPRFGGVTIIEDLPSGGVVNITFNDWGSGHNYLLGIEMISMQSYQDYFTVPMFGYGQAVGFPQDNPAVYPGHLIGTGPYEFVEHESDIGRMIRFDNWWNSTAQQAEGWHTVEEIAVAIFPHSATGYQARSTAMSTGDIHWAFDHSWEPLDYLEMMAAPDVRYVEMGLEDYGENIILNSVNETYLRLWDYLNVSGAAFYMPPSMLYPDGTINAHGINRALRKAISYAFDYNTFLSVGMKGRVARSGGFLGKTNYYYDESIPIATTDLTIARQALLDDPYWSSVCADRQLGISNSTTEWEQVAETNPLYRLEFHWDRAHLYARYGMETCLKRIGCGINLVEDNPSTYEKMTTFDFPYTSCDAFSLKPYFIRINNLGYIAAYYRSPGVVEEAPAYPPGYPVISNYDGSGNIFPYSQFANWGFNYNATCDEIIDEIWFANESRTFELYSQLTDWMQNFQYPSVFLGNDMIGHAVNKEWDYSWQWITLHYNLVKYLGPEQPTPIPGFQVYSILIASLLALIGIAYTIIRKNKHL